jgi:CheY-like chemotaxis protein
MNQTSFSIGKTNPLAWLLAWLWPGARPKACAPAPPVTVEKPPVASNGKKILVVDDDAVILKTTSWKLQRQGYTVVSATDPAGALRSVREDKPDLILLDVSFPPEVSCGGYVSWDGFQTMTWLLRLESSRNIPIILFSGSDPAKCKRNSLAGRETAFVLKPLDPGSLVTTIERALDKAGPPPPPSQLNFQI